ncbi:hypothetical protein GQ55_8G077400 [Panicum hallii var. hallii]|uniref:Uncharacterized protein n=2 Tax=Panicum sect. Panicum TaxID=2100772 RepID=A0A3L6PKZ9_PANMI|nr:hypothetical protein GQ55_8G077400 [Panicum hallii var. hallii]RLM57989.1 hypothetical protein C2845_PM18G04080 [Panicum miliaceum]
MADAGGANVPGAYFIGRPANAAEQQPPAAAAAEPTPAHTQTPGDYFIGTPENRRPQAVVAEPAQPAGDLKRSRSFLEWFPCLRGGQVAN